MVFFLGESFNRGSTVYTYVRTSVTVMFCADIHVSLWTTRVHA